MQGVMWGFKMIKLQVTSKGVSIMQQVKNIDFKQIVMKGQWSQNWQFQLRNGLSVPRWKKVVDSCEKKIPHTGNTRPSCLCVIKEYRYYTISLSKYHEWCQYHKCMYLGSKRFFKKSRKVKNSQYGQKWSIWSKLDKKKLKIKSKTV